MSTLKEIKKQASSLQEGAQEQSVSYITAALSLVAGLAWNDAITSLIKEIFPIGTSNLLAKFFYALVMTVVVVSLTLLVRNIFQRRSK